VTVRPLRDRDGSAAETSEAHDRVAVLAALECRHHGVDKLLDPVVVTVPLRGRHAGDHEEENGENCREQELRAQPERVEFVAELDRVAVAYDDEVDRKQNARDGRCPELELQTEVCILVEVHLVSFQFGPEGHQGR